MRKINGSNTGRSIVTSMRMLVDLDREYIKQKHYISPGGFCFTFGNGKTINFDFEYSMCDPYRYSNNKIIIEMNNLDLSYSPESKDLADLLLNEKITSIDEFYFYTGEKNDPEIKVIGVEGLTFFIEEHATLYENINVFRGTTLYFIRERELLKMINERIRNNE